MAKQSREHSPSNLKETLLKTAAVLSMGSLALTGCGSEKVEAQSGEGQSDTVATSQSEPSVKFVPGEKKTESQDSQAPEQKEKHVDPFYKWDMTAEDVRLLITDYDNLDRAEKDAAVHDWFTRQTQANPELGVYDFSWLNDGRVYYEDAPGIAETVSTMFNTLVAFTGDYGNNDQMLSLGISDTITESDPDIKIYSGKRKFVHNILDSMVGLYVIDREALVENLEDSVCNRFMMSWDMVDQGILSKDLTTDHYTFIDPQISEGYPMKHTQGADVVYDLSGKLKGNQKMIDTEYMPHAHNKELEMTITFNYGGKIFGFSGAGSTYTK